MSKRVAIYARVSTEDQNCERQLHDLRAFANRAGYTVVDEFTEKASGTKNDRQQRKQVLALAQARKIDAVLVTELTRWGRSSSDLFHTLEQLAAWNVSVIAERGMTFDLSTAQGKLMARIMSDLAEFERDLIAERTRSGMAAAKAAGKHVGRPTGNRTNGKHAPQVLELLQLGLSMDAIAGKLHISKSTVAAIKKQA